jgi:hypothetical protein
LLLHTSLTALRPPRRSVFIDFFAFMWGFRLMDGSTAGLHTSVFTQVHDREALTVDDLMEEELTTYKRACGQRMRLLARAARPRAAPSRAAAAAPAARDAVPATTLDDYAYILDVFDLRDEEVHLAYGVHHFVLAPQDVEAAVAGLPGAPCPSPHWGRAMTRFSEPGALRVAVTALRLTDGAMTLLLNGETREERWHLVRAWGTLPFPYVVDDDANGGSGSPTESDLLLRLRWEYDDGSEYDRLVSATLDMASSGWSYASAAFDVPEDGAVQRGMTQAAFLLALERLEWV